MLWVQRKYDALTKLGLPRARAVELLSRYSGYNKSHIYEIVGNPTKEGSSGVVSERKPIKIEKEIAATVEPTRICVFSDMSVCEHVYFIIHTRKKHKAGFFLHLL